MCARRPTSTAASPASSAGSPRSISRNTATSRTRSRRIAAKNHKNGVGNPYAQMRKDLGYEFCRRESEKNPFVAGPLKRTDCSLVSDGAAAIVLADAETAQRLGKAVAFRAAAHVQDFLPMSKRDILKFEGCALAWQRALAEAGLALGDLSFVETHDCFTIAELIEYEAMGLVPEGRGASAIKDGLTEMSGRLPVNPSGGLKAKGHPIGATGVSMHALCGDAAHRHGRRFPGEGRAARRPLQHGRRRGRELREHPGADQIARCVRLTRRCVRGFFVFAPCAGSSFETSFVSACPTIVARRRLPSARGRCRALSAALRARAGAAANP